MAPYIAITAPQGKSLSLSDLSKYAKKPIRQPRLIPTILFTEKFYHVAVYISWPSVNTEEIQFGCPPPHLFLHFMVRIATCVGCNLQK